MPHAAISFMFKHCVICNENITLFVMIMITDIGKALIRGDQILLADLKYRSTTSEQLSILSC